MMSKNNLIEHNTTHYIVAVIKEYGIKNIITSPGQQNAYFNSIVQEDPFFNCYSIVDERSACYVASGIAYETNEPVIITCTGATASRNYLSGMTEAYYKNLPIIAITFHNLITYNKYKMYPQFVDRSVTQDDVKRISVNLPYIHNENDKNDCLIYLNAALSAAKYNGNPVHINAPNIMDFSKKGFPKDIWTTKIYSKVDDEIENEIKNKDTIIYIASHNKFTKEEENSISRFAENYNIPVVIDHTSNYHGKNKVMVSKITQAGISKKPELVIDIGGISGEYGSFSFIKESKIWRISPSHEYNCRVGIPVEKLFYMSETEFFSSFKGSSNNNLYAEYIKNELDKINLPELPLSNPFICHELSKYVERKSSVHLSILNSFRSMNYFDLDETIDTTCNVGGFGIDGALSTMVGQSLVNTNKKIYGLIGDLAFFYDMNILGNRHIGKNLRILLVNNNRGEEFRLNPILEKHLGEKTDEHIAAGRHYKNGARAWVESCGLYYMSAHNKEEFLAKIKDFCVKDYSSSVVFEVFTKNEDEQEAYRIMLNLGAKNVKKAIKNKKNFLLQKIIKK